MRDPYLVGHGRATNLGLFEGFLDLLQVGEVADVRADTGSSGTKSADGVGNAEVDLPSLANVVGYAADAEDANLASVGLGRNGVARREAGLLAKDL